MITHNTYNKFKIENIMIMKVDTYNQSLPSRALSAFFTLAAGALFCIMPAIAHASPSLTLDFAANPGSTIQFNGSPTGGPSFQFNDGTNGYQFNVTGEQGGSSALGLNGLVSNGPFFYGPVTSLGDFFNTQYATVTGPLGDLVISDGTGDLTGTVNFIQVSTYGGIFGGFGALNGDLVVNVTNISYYGTNADLQTLVANQPGAMDVSFTFGSPETLTQLSTAPTPITTSYSASLTVVPVSDSSASLTMLVFGACVLLFASRRWVVTP